MTKAYVKFPRVGLGNMMLIWARGVVFARINNIELITSSWSMFHWGALYRREKKNRLYYKYFIESSILERINSTLSLFIFSSISDPKIQVIENKNKRNLLFVFKTVVIEDDLFNIIRDYREMIIDELYKLLHPKMKTLLHSYPVPKMSVHIRRGDFVLGNQTTSLQYFMTGINLIRSTLGYNIPVTIFTDAKKVELLDILKLENVVLAEEKPDILDIILMSKSSILMLSKSSTFSYWAAFLSQALVIIPKNDWQKKIRDSGSQNSYQEIRWDDNDKTATKLLIEVLKSHA